MLMDKIDLKGLKELMWNFILKYFIINYLIKRYRFSRIFVIVWYISIKHASKHFEVIWTMRFEI